MAHLTLPERSVKKSQEAFPHHGNPHHLLVFHENLFSLERGINGNMGDLTKAWMGLS